MTFEEIWVMKNGLCVVNACISDSKVNPMIFSALMSSICQFSEQSLKDTVDNITLVDNVFTFVRKSGSQIMIIGRSNNKDHNLENKIKLLRNILDLFNFQYHDNFWNIWDGDISLFDSFQTILRKNFIKR